MILGIGCGRWSSAPRPLESLVIGAAARTVSTVATVPLTLIKTRYEVYYVTEHEFIVSNRNFNFVTCCIYVMADLSVNYLCIMYSDP